MFLLRCLHGLDWSRRGALGAVPHHADGRSIDVAPFVPDHCLAGHRPYHCFVQGTPIWWRWRLAGSILYLAYSLYIVYSIQYTVYCIRVRTLHSTWGICGLAKQWWGCQSNDEGTTHALIKFDVVLALVPAQVAIALMMLCLCLCLSLHSRGHTCTSLTFTVFTISCVRCTACACACAWVHARTSNICLVGNHDVLHDCAVSGESFIEELLWAVYKSSSSEFQTCLMPERRAVASAFTLQSIICTLMYAKI